MTKRSIKSFKIIMIIFLTIFFFNISKIRLTNASFDYSIALEKGTQIYEVKFYNDAVWEQTVNTTSNPNDWFMGDANLIGSKSKTTILDWMEDDLLIYILIRDLIIPKNILPVFFFIENYGYNFTYFLNNYPGYHKVWEYNLNFWDFRSNNDFDYTNDSTTKSIILQNPDEYNKLINDYNNFSTVVNNDSILQSLGYSLPFLTGDEILWHFILERFTLAAPINNYLITLVNALGCKNVTVQDHSLIIRRKGITNYIVDVIYNNQGNLETFVLKNSEGYEFYKITSYSPKFVVLIIITICLICVSTLIVYHLYRKKKRN